MKLTICIIVYACMGVFSFGHALNNNAFSNIDAKSFGVAGALIAWPLYWSWELQRKDIK